MESPDEVAAANRRAEHLRRTTPYALAARFDRRTRRIVVHLSSQLGIFFSPKKAQGLEHATADDLSEIEISPSGFGLYFPRLDADLYLPAMLEGAFGSQKWSASRMGQSGGSSRSAAKVGAARENGKRGGRPRRVATP